MTFTASRRAGLASASAEARARDGTRKASESGGEGSDGEERRVGVSDSAREHHYERHHEHGRDRERPPDEHELRTAGLEPRENLSSWLRETGKGVGWATL